MPHAPTYGSNAVALDMMPTLHPWSLDALGMQLASRNVYLVTAGSTAYPAASLALYVPIRLAAPVNVDGFWCYNGTSVTNSVDMGLFLPDGGYVTSLGLQTRTGTSAIQVFPVTPLDLPAGEYAMALSLNGATGSFFASSPAAEIQRGWGVYQQDLSGASPPGTLPTAGATYAPLTVGYLPVFGLRRAGCTI